jgi:hypothetical protein
MINTVQGLQDLNLAACSLAAAGWCVLLVCASPMTLYSVPPDRFHPRADIDVK